jgi:hypothetical protein
MNLKSRLDKLANFKFCPACGSDWQQQQQENRANKQRILRTLQRLFAARGVDKSPLEFLESSKRDFPQYMFWAQYREDALVGWEQSEIPEGFCLCGRVLRPLESTEEILARFVAKLQSEGASELEAQARAQKVMEGASELASKLGLWE